MKMMITLGVLFITSIQPMLIILSMIMIVLFYSLYMKWMLMSFWFSYMMILVLMSGVLVIFTYMMSVLPNESFENSGMLFLLIGMYYLYNKLNYYEFVLDLSISSMEIWVSYLFVVSMFLVMYLLFLMILVVWISMMEMGAIRIM
uniref:NADH dehydrogenase subunit 6 n=1 Tax=Araneus angulatus TaxID=1112382 RepID=A0A1L2C9U3_ARAAN|nr:NADH dehydrogenase subunit 6 [Araneus angulatus]AMD83665.1 NADH dehydrogenase subunit 6 [Araneus angulatus]